MSKAGKSILVFSVYMFALGLILLFIPNVLLSLFGIPDTNEVWIRVVGMLVLILGGYYLQAARNDLVPFFRASVVGRFSVLVFLTVFVVAGFAPASLILFGVIDAAAAAWTALSLR